jgi:prepilin-type processing-associated H-X9-DG protein
MFKADHNYYPPFLDPTDYTENRNWKNALGYEMDIHSNATFYPKGVWHCPSTSRPASNYPANWGYDNYGYNMYGLGLNLTNSLGLSEHWIPSQPTPHVNESEVVNPSEMIVIGDGFFGGPSVIQDGAGLGRASDNEILASLSGSFTPPSDFFTESTKRSRARHQGKANVVFCDGHVESPTLQFLFADTSDAALSRWNRDHQPHREKLSP